MREDPEVAQRLDLFDSSWYRPGGWLRCAAWTAVSGLLFQGWMPWPQVLKVRVLRMFGAKVGRGVVVKPRLTIKYPWFLSVGDHCWLGEGAWIDCLAPVTLGNHVCVSQGVLIETGNHDWSDPAFGLKLGPVSVGEGAWLAVRSTLLPGTTVGSHAVVGAGVTVSGTVDPGTVVAHGPLSTRPRKGRAAAR